MRELVLDRDAMIKVVTDPSLYTACQEFRDIETLAYQLHAEYRESGKGRCCGPLPTIMLPVLDRFLAKLHELLAGDRPAVERLRRFLAARVGRSSESPVVRVYYRTSNEGPATRFRF